MRILIKLGGTLLDSPESRERLAGEIAALKGVSAVVVHGGGKQMTRFLRSSGIESRFINGLRVTTPEVLEAVLAVVAGSVNRRLVAALVGAGVRAVGLSGIDGGLTEAEPISEELGAVGRPVRTNPELLELLTTSGYLPVIACVAGDRHGRAYNVNADHMAVSCAVAYRADRILFLTDVEGVRGNQGELLPELTLERAQGLIQAGIATGGMQAKLEAAAQALGQGVREVLIAPGSVRGVLQRCLGGDLVGSRVIG